MARTRKRMIAPGILRNKKMVRVSQTARLLFVGMITEADDHGYGDADLTQLKCDFFPLDTEVTVEVLEQCCKALYSVGLAKFSQTEDGGIYYRLIGWEGEQSLRKEWKHEDAHKLKFDAGTPLYGTVQNCTLTNSINIPNITNNLNIKEKDITAAEKKPPCAKQKKQSKRKPDFDAVDKCLEKYSGKKQTPATVQMILTGCNGKIDPLHLIETAYDGKHENPVGVIFDACKAPGRYGELRPWKDFVNKIWPAGKSMSTLGDVLKESGISGN